MKIKKNLKKTKAEGFNVWEVFIPVLEFTLVITILIGVIVYIYTHITLKT